MPRESSGSGGYARPELEPPLRDYQRQIINDIYRLFNGGKRSCVLSLPTGAGKTRIAAEFLHHSAWRGRRAAFACDRIALVDQSADAFGGANLEYGVLQADNTRNEDAPIIVASVQTVLSRGVSSDFGLIVVDECHTMHKSVNEWVAEVVAAGGFAIGLSATPMAKGMKEVWGDIVSGPTAHELAQMTPQRLVHPVLYAEQRGQANADNFAVNTLGEYDMESAEAEMVKFVTNVPEEYLKCCDENHGGERVQALAFSPTVAYGARLVEAFADAGVEAEQVSYKTKPKECAAAIQRFRDGLTTVLVSVDKLAKGFDVPDARIGLMCKPLRKSDMTFIQSVGRILRPAEGKTRADILDFTGNIKDRKQGGRGFGARYIDWYRNGVKTLLEKKQKAGDGEAPTWECPQCGALNHLAADHCHACGEPRPAGKTKVDAPVKPSEFADLGEEDVFVTPEDAWDLASEEAWEHRQKRIDYGVNENDPEISEARLVRRARGSYFVVMREWPDDRRLAFQTLSVVPHSLPKAQAEGLLGLIRREKRKYAKKMRDENKQQQPPPMVTDTEDWFGEAK